MELTRWTGSRALSPREAEVLAFLLAADDQRLVPLRRQAETATVSGGCGCACPSIDLAVDRQRSSAGIGLGRPAVTTVSREVGQADEVWWLHSKCVLGVPPSAFEDAAATEALRAPLRSGSAPLPRIGHGGPL